MNKNIIETAQDVVDTSKDFMLLMMRIMARRNDDNPEDIEKFNKLVKRHNTAILGLSISIEEQNENEPVVTMKSTDEIADQLIGSLIKDPILDEVLEPLPNKVWKPLHSRFKKILDDSQTNANNIQNTVQGLYDKMRASGAHVIKASLKDDYSQNGQLQIMLHNDGDIGLVISKGGIPEEEEIQYADITIASEAHGGSYVNSKVITHLHSIIAELHE